MQSFASYDPLAIEHGDDSWLFAARKREIRNILKSYTGYYDPFAELLQNALDAVERRASEEDDDYSPRVWVRIDLSEREISVTDNGCGMDLEEFKHFLKPNLSFKTGGQTRGMKGVGATYLAYGFNDLHVSTRKDGMALSGRITQGREWVEDNDDFVSIPLFEMSDSVPHERFEIVDNGTSVTIRLVGSGIRPKDLTWAGASDAKQWLALLRVHTPVGAVYEDPDQPEINTRIHVEVIDTDGVVSNETMSNPSYMYPHREFSSVLQLREYLNWLKMESEKGNPPRPTRKYSNMTAFWITMNADEILNDKALFQADKLSAEQQELVTSLNLHIYYFMCYSNELWAQLKQEVGLNRRAKFLQGGLQIATRHMPQGPLLEIPLNRMLGFQNITHIIAHIDAEPDLGRKGFQPEHVELVKTLAQRFVEQLGMKYRWHLLRRRDSTVSVVKELRLQKWIDEQRAHEEEYPLIIRNPEVFAPLTYLPTRSEPQVEQDVVALFNQMLAAGIIRGIHLLSSSQFEQYDGLYRRILDVPYATYVYDADTNPLGVMRDSMSSNEEPFESKIKILEYKYSLDALIEELSQQDKDAKSLDLVVAWERGSAWRDSYSITSYLIADNVRHRAFHGYTHQFNEMMSGSLVFNAIILKDLISYLNDPSAEERRQASLDDRF